MMNPHILKTYFDVFGNCIQLYSDNQNQVIEHSHLHRMYFGGPSVVYSIASWPTKITGLLSNTVILIFLIWFDIFHLAK